jgi:hypothetical protein
VPAYERRHRPLKVGINRDIIALAASAISEGTITSMATTTQARSSAAAERYPQSGATGEFGYRDRYGTMRWFPIAGLDSGLGRRPPGPRAGPAPQHVGPLDRAPHFDEAGRFIHPCCQCGRDGFIGFGVNVSAGRLGTWYCGACGGWPELS